MNTSTEFATGRSGADEHQRDRPATAWFAIIFVAAAALTVTATLFAVSGAGPFGPASPVMLWLVCASLALSVVLAGFLGLRIVRIAGGRGVTETGARLHLRFASLFSLAAVVPAIIVALFLGATISRGVEQWFSDQVKTVVENAAGVGRLYIQSVESGIRSQVMAMANDVDQPDAAQGLREQPERFAGYLRDQAQARGFASAYLLDAKGRPIARGEPPRAPPFEAPSSGDLADAGKGAIPISLFERAGLLRSLVKLNSYPGAYLYVSQPIDEGMLGQLRTYEQAVIAYRETERRRAGLQTLFVLSYLATAWLVLLGAVWVGLSNASRIAEPIGRLAEAAGRVASGDLAARVGVSAERDEVDALGRAFNRMTAQLQTQRADLVNARQDAESRSRFIRAVLAGVSAGVVGLDPDGRVRVANRSAEALLGVAEGELEGRRLLDVAPEFRSVLQGDHPLPDEGPHRVDLVRDGGTIHLSLRRSLDPGGAGGVVLTFDDMTKLIAAQRQEAWKDVARRIAHEIKNPLTPIQLSAERIQRKYANEIRSDPEVFQRCTDTILRQVADIGRMVDEFSAFARMPIPRMGAADLTELLRANAFAQRLAFPDTRFEFEGPEGQVLIWCDERLIAQALTNILKNAGEAVGARRSRDGEPKEGRVIVRLEETPTHAIVSIIDNGLGLPVKDRARLVEPYVTTRAKGTGLGLAIVQRVVEDHGGALELHDAPGPGPGAMVRIVLPKSSNPGADTDAQGREVV
jgi:two-component system nitrogen regulation sensor histidine kinase NtrY